MPIFLKGTKDYIVLRIKENDLEEGTNTNPFDIYSTITFSLPAVCRLEAVPPSGRCLFSDGFPYQVHHRLVIDTAVSGEPYLTGAAVGVTR